MRVRRYVAIVVIAAGVAASAFASTAEASTPSAQSDSNTLAAGHCLTTTSNDELLQLPSQSGEFALTGYYGSVDIDEDVTSGHAGEDYSVWSATAAIGSDYHMSICLRPGGDLEVMVDGRLRWSSHTGTKAWGGYAVMTNAGALEIRTHAGVPVWSTHTTRVLLTQGDTLTAGSELVNSTYPGQLTKLYMGPYGDLTLWLNDQLVWHSNTRVAGAAGSHLEITPGGRMSVVTPTGRTLWFSAKAGTPAFLQVSQRGRLSLMGKGGSPCYALPVSKQSECDYG